MGRLALDRVEDFGDSQHEEILDSGCGIVDSRVQSTDSVGPWLLDKERQLRSIGQTYRQPKAPPVIKLTLGRHAKLSGIERR